MIQRNNIEHLYLHVPFCESICYYCDFCHARFNEELCKKWIETIRKEIIQKEINPNLKTIYIGGGTPTSLDYELLKELLDLLKPYSNHVEEYTIEINPGTLDIHKSKLIKEYGINRASIGLQSHDNELLKMLGRMHNSEDVINTINLLRNEGIDNISLDVMYSLPSQTIDSLNETIDFVLDLKPKHISLYSLTIEENTVFGKKGYEALNEDLEADMYELIRNKLEKNNYRQYEISNYSLDGYQSKHNKAYWHYKDYYGIGAGASGKEGNIRYSHSKNINEYINGNDLEIINLNKIDKIFETIMMGLRLKEGINIKEINDRYNIDIEKMFSITIKENIEKGNLIIGEYIKCSKDGLEILNTILVDFLEELD